jgi:hypothetical protein
VDERSTGFLTQTFWGGEKQMLSDYVSGIKEEECFICEGDPSPAKGQPQ